MNTELTTITLILVTKKRLLLFRYGYAQRMKLPIGGYEFMDEAEIEESFADMLRDYNQDTIGLQEGFIAEVDLSYPEHLHHLHESYPLAPHPFTPRPEDLSDYQNKCHSVLNTKPSTVKKLSATFLKREKYVVHALNLKLYQRLGMKIEKVHRVLTFQECEFLRKYINFCTDMRSKSTTKIGSRFWKLMNNSVFGKWIEDTSKYINMGFATNAEYAKKSMSNPKFKHFMVINEKLIGLTFERKKQEVKQAVAIGFSILELSKELMYRTYYEKIVPSLGEKCRVLFSDTDSLFISCESENPLRKLKSILDTSNFDKSHPLRSLDRKSKVGYFKSEVGSSKISKFIGLRSKVYSFISDDGRVAKCKGVSKNYQKNLQFLHFEKCLSEICSVSTPQRNLISQKHKIMLAKQQKLCFSSYDDKFYIKSCGIHTTPFGSKKQLSRDDKCDVCK